MIIGERGRPCDTLGQWRVSWTAYCEEPMFKVSRKVERMRSIEHGRPFKSRRRRIVAIRPVASVPVRCISVDSPSHLYLCGKGWIPTHNTEAGNNWNNFQNFNPFSLYKSAGFGARIFMPAFGLIGLNWAYGFDTLPGSTQRSGSQFHFTIGQQIR